MVPKPGSPSVRPGGAVTLLSDSALHGVAPKLPGYRSAARIDLCVPTDLHRHMHVLCGISAKCVWPVQGCRVVACIATKRL